jgi:branched-chain amino acid transport system permease protein
MLQVILSGLASGAIYGLMAMAFAVVFYVTRVINFATGQLLMIAIMIAAAISAAGLPPPLALGAGMATSTVLGVVIYVIAVRPVLRRDRTGFAWLVSTLGIAIVIQSAAAIVWGPTSRAFPALLHRDIVFIGEASLSWQQIAAIVVAIGAGVAYELIRRRTMFGKVGMAISADPEMASAFGADVTRHSIIAFAVGGLLAGTAGMLVGPITFANPYLGETYGITGFVALMIGGIDKPVAALGGGFVLGLLTVAANTYIDSQASDWFPFLVIVVVLLVAPRGLFASGLRWRRSRIELAGASTGS